MKTMKEALDIVGGFSTPSKMPWYGWSTPVSECPLGVILAKQKGTICSICYADKGMYRFSNAQKALKKRFEALKHPQFVDAFVFALEQKLKRQNIKENRFRWHDSGDLTSYDHLLKVVEIARRVPKVRFWLPTRQLNFLKRFFDEGGVLPDNLTVRTSATKIGERAKRAPFGLPESTSGLDTAPGVHHCPARKQNNQCKACDACWRRDVPIVNYEVH